MGEVATTLPFFNCKNKTEDGARKVQNLLKSFEIRKTT